MFAETRDADPRSLPPSRRSSFFFRGIHDDKNRDSDVFLPFQLADDAPGIIRG